MGTIFLVYFYCYPSYYIVSLLDLVYILFSCVNIRMIETFLYVCVCVCVCLSVCLSVWYVILEHEDKNMRAELTPILISQSKFSFHVQRSLKHTITYTYLSLLMWSIM